MQSIEPIRTPGSRISGMEAPKDARWKPRSLAFSENIDTKIFTALDGLSTAHCHPFKLARKNFMTMSGLAGAQLRYASGRTGHPLPQPLPDPS